MLKILKIVAMSCVLLAVAGAGGLYWLVSSPIPLANERVEFHVTYGKGMSAVAREIATSGVPMNPWLLVLLGKVYGVESSIKAGSYEITRGITPLELLRKLTSGDVTQGEIVFIEGWNFRQIRARLDAHPDLRHDTRGLSDAEIMAKVGAPASFTEGMFFPDTYLFSKQTSDVEVLARAYRAMQQHLAREWAGRASDLPYADPYQALIMASIVEKETGRQEDRSHVASVFVNRLRLGMRLQTDPTVIYGVGEGFDGNLRKRDLLADTPYNTYTRAGLPPTPIAMPGLASLRAAVNPAPGRALYFVARGDGSSQFSETLEQHNHAVNRYQRRGQRPRDGGDK